MSYDRKLWVIEQIGYPPLPPVAETIPSQTAIHTTTYQDTVSTQASALVNLSAIELGAKLSTRCYTLLSESSGEYKDVNRDRRTTATFEIARSYVTRHKHYGRLGVEFVEFLPHRWRFIRLGIATGILAEDNVYLKANVSLFRKLSQESPDSHVYHSALELGRIFSRGTDEWRLGGSLAWSYRTRNTQDDSPLSLGYEEHMLFTLAPFAEYSNRSFYIRAFMNFRLWLDKEIFIGPSLNNPAKDAQRVRYPTVTNYPDVGIVLSLVL